VGDELAIAFTALDGRKVDIAALKGKAVLVYFWASSVSDYNKFHPALKGTYEKFHDAGFEVIGISLDEDEAALRSFIKKENIPGPQAFDGKGLKSDWVEKYGIIYTPFYFLFGRDGKFADYGGEGPELETKVAELMK
jgi:peroxiredoxin